MKCLARTRLLLLLLLFIVAAKQPAYSQAKETIHIHTDRDIYLPGETIYFKAYLFYNNAPSSSTNLYAGFYDLNGRSIQQKTYPIFFGTAYGDFQVPDSFDLQGVQLRFFTKNMLASGAGNAFLKSVYVYQRSKNDVSFTDTKPGDISIAAFPEGGQLVAGVINHITFKASAPVMPNAWITDGAGQTLDSIVFNSNGLGKTQLLAEAGKQYFLKWQSSALALPPAMVNSAALHTEISAGNIHYSINRNSTSPRLAKLTLQIKDATDTLYTEKLDLGNKLSFTNKISTAMLPAGLLQVNLLDQQNNILQQKYIATKSGMSAPEIKIIERSKAPKGKNKIEIELKDTSIHFFSVAVVDENFMLDEGPASIRNELLTGVPGNYLAAENNKTADMFLQTLAPGSAEPKSFTADNYLSAVAKYNDSKPLPPRSELSLILNDTANGRQFFNILPSGNNSFFQTGLIFYDSAKFYYQLNNKLLSEKISVAIARDINQPDHIAATTIIQPGSSVVRQMQKNDSAIYQYASGYPGKLDKVKTIETVVVKSRYENPITKRLLELDEKYTSGMYSGLARGVQFNLLDDPNAYAFIDLYSYIANRIPSVRVERTKISIGGNDSIIAKAFVSTRGGGQEKLILTLLIDEREATFDMLETLPVSQIAYVKAITGIYIGSSFTSSAGAILVYTKKPEDYQSKTPGMKYQLLKGYDRPLRFTQPDYSTPPPATVKDYRPTLFWDADIVCDNINRKFVIEYFNNDLSRNPILVIKGISQDGNIVELVKKIE